MSTETRSERSMFSRFFKRKPKVAQKMRIEPSGVEIEVPHKTPLLTAALDAGIPFPHNCRVGGCASCKCRLVEGEVKEMTDKSYLLTAEEMADNYILACQSIPKTAVVVEVPNLNADGRPQHEIKKTDGTIASLNKLTHDIVELVIDVDTPLEFTAGQYADISVPGVIDEPRSYSFASAPGERAQSKLRFFVRHIEGGEMSSWLHQSAKVGDKVHVNGPLGDFWMRRTNAPILAAAGGSGLAPVLSLLAQARAEETRRDVVLLFGVRTQQDLYAMEEIEKLRSRWLSRFIVHPVLSEEPDGSDWDGGRGFLHDFAKANVADLGSHEIYACGPPVMIDALERVALEAGVAKDAVFYDKFLDKSHTAALAKAPS